jgi:mRNA-degrading endonuclease YafQ of YafQ-DinJ toxin-antitoxin module
MERVSKLNITGDVRLIYKNEDFAYRLARVGTHSELYGS